MRLGSVTDFLSHLPLGDEQISGFCEGNLHKGTCGVPEFVLKSSSRRKRRCNARHSTYRA